MIIRKMLTAIFALAVINLNAQKNFSYTPEKPKPGDVITFTYTPAGDIANTLKPVEAAVYQDGPGGRKADDLVLEKKAGKYTGHFTADIGSSFIYLAFSADKKFDNNFNEGYSIILYESEKPRSSAYNHKARFYSGGGRQAGLDVNQEKALVALEKEFEYYPENKKTYLNNYVRLRIAEKKEDAPKIIQKEIEAILKAGLIEETDYSSLESLYAIARLPEQQKFIASVKKEKFPNGKWVISETTSKLSEEKDIDKKKAILADIAKKVETDENWKSLEPNMVNYKSQIAWAYIDNKDWVNFKKAVDEAKIDDKQRLALMYDEAASEIVKTNDNLPMAEEFSRLATSFAKESWQYPAGKKPDYYTHKQWTESNRIFYASCASTYGQVAYKQGEYKKGLPFAKEAAMDISKGKIVEQNSTYALLAEKTLLKKQYVKELEQFVMDGKSSGEIKDVLKRAYVKDKKSETGYDDYITNLEKSAMEKMLEELRKIMLNDKAPAFALVDLDGKKISLGELAGKVVVVDFWATWCGPCKASFPAMQKMVNKYKDDPNVKFVFVDTWERSEEKEKNAAEFIASNKYTFHVLMDNEDKVVAEFKVQGIPTKFVIDKKGFIRFKSVGFDGSDDKLMNELTAMIDMASKDVAPKAF